MSTIDLACATSISIVLVEDGVVTTVIPGGVNLCGPRLRLLDSMWVDPDRPKCFLSRLKRVRSSDRPRRELGSCLQRVYTSIGTTRKTEKSVTNAIQASVHV